jgi:hypothetical protein
MGKRLVGWLVGWLETRLQTGTKQQSHLWQVSESKWNLCECEALAYLRFRHLGRYFMEPSDYLDVPTYKILHYIRSAECWRDNQRKGKHNRPLWVAVQGPNKPTPYTYIHIRKLTMFPRRVNIFPRQRTRDARIENCWKRSFVCGPCRGFSKIWSWVPGTPTWEWLHWWGPGAIENDRTAFTSERVPHINKPQLPASNKNLVLVPK